MNLKVKNIIRLVINSILTIVAVMGVTVMVLSCIGIQNRVVMSGSMEPTVKTGSLCFVDTNVKYEDISKNDIISFKINDTYVLHRAIDITEEGIETKGDNNDVSDGITTTGSNLQGRYIVHIPEVGYVLYSTKMKIICATAIVSLFILSTLLEQSIKDEKIKLENESVENNKPQMEE